MLTLSVRGSVKSCDSMGGTDGGSGTCNATVATGDGLSSLVTVPEGSNNVVE